MFFRGGILIEPWKPFIYYTDVEKAQSVVLYGDALYICNTSHQSGATFGENMSLFTLVGSGLSGGGGGGVYLGDLDLTPPYSLSPDAKNGDVFRCSVAGEFAGHLMNVGDLGTLIFDGADCLITPNYTVIGSMINDALSTAIGNTITDNIANAITASVEADGEVDLAITNKITTSVQSGGEIEQAITNAVIDDREKHPQDISLSNTEDGNTYYLSADDGNGGQIIYPSTKFTITGPIYINAINIIVDQSAFLEGDILSIHVDTTSFGGQIGTLSITSIGNTFNPIHLGVLSGSELYLSFAIVKAYGTNIAVFLGSNSAASTGSSLEIVTISQILNQTDNTTVPLTSNEVSILVNDSVARDELIFSIGDELFIGNLPVRVTVETNATITNLRFDFGGQSSPLEQTILANQKMIFVFQRRGDFKELMSRTVL